MIIAKTIARSAMRKTVNENTARVAVGHDHCFAWAVRRSFQRIGQCLPNKRVRIFENVSDRHRSKRVHRP